MRFVVLVVDHTGPFNIDLRIIEHPVVFGEAVVGSNQNVEFRGGGLLVEQLACLNDVSVLEEPSEVDNVKFGTVLVYYAQPFWNLPVAGNYQERLSYEPFVVEFGNPGRDQPVIGHLLVDVFGNYD